jgi:hypothetical protein
MNGLQRLPKAEEQALIAVAIEHGLDVNDLACYMTRQQGHGRKAPDPDSGSFFDGAGFSISYDLMLCEFCGNLEPSEVCPAKVEVIRRKLLEGGDDGSVEA